MRLHPDLDEFKYDLKENTGRRVIAGLIDHVLLLLPIILIAGFITVAMNSMNPVALIIGPIAGLLPYSVYGPTPPHILVSMIAFPIVQLIIIVPYFTFLESSGRRTLGKRAMHLEVLNKKERYPTKTQAFMRNLMKFVIGTISIYLLGVLGWAVIIGVTGLLDLKMKPGSKNDVRQRLTEVKYGTMVFLEDDALSFGSIFLPGQKIAEKKGRGSMSRKSKSTIVMGKKKGRSKLPKRNAPAQLSPAESEKDAGIEKAPDLSLGSQDRKEPEPDTAGTEEGDMDQEEEKEPAEKKAPFWKKLFGGGKKEEDVHLGNVPGPDEMVVKKEPEGLPPRKDIGRDETVLQFMFDFDISEERSQAIYDMGYRNKAEFKDAIPRDLIMIKGINPTIAKRIVQMANE